MDEYIRAQEQLFQKDEAYSKTIITLGYAGLFGIWAFVNPHLFRKAILTTALLAGSSLIIYIGWEVAQMVDPSTRQLRFNLALPVVEAPRGVRPDKFSPAGVSSRCGSSILRVG
jgi:hypothetical protein